MHARYPMAQMLLQRLKFFAMKLKGQSEVKNFGINGKALSQGMHL